MFARFRAVAVCGFGVAVLAASPAMARQDEPLPRFEGAVCPGVIGLKQDAAETLVGLIRGNVETLGVRTDKEAVCDANVVVAFVDDGRAYLNGLKAENSPLLLEMETADRDALLAETGSARVLLKIRARSRDGMPIPRRENMTDIPVSGMWQAHSRIYLATRNDILSALVLIDRKAVSGLSLAQIADYVTFRALTQTLPPESAREELIVSLFDQGAPHPDGLTEFDRKMLATLYDGPPNLPGSAILAALEKATGAPFTAED